MNQKGFAQLILMIVVVAGGSFWYYNSQPNRINQSKRRNWVMESPYGIFVVERK